LKTIAHEIVSRF